ncbi:hypothetical protein O6H91_11G110100 [Diphasiastrum complanatum]|nr:hypothetical protein O6H91_11G110100 [Diphasiastrum complanatum]
MDSMSKGRGVRQFKTSLLQDLEKGGESSMKQRTQTSDAREIESFYKMYYKSYVKDRETAHFDRESLAKAYQTSGVLFEVLKSFISDELSEEIMAIKIDVDNKMAKFTPYNILPLDLAGEAHTIMQFDEVKASLQALRNTRGLPQAKIEQLHSREQKPDIFDWLQAIFGFQKSNVANQREHLILLLANVQTSLSSKPEPLIEMISNENIDRAIDVVLKKLFKNYIDWCMFLGKTDNLRLPGIHSEVQQRKIIYMGLYLLIWGEAANLRFMPECLCYIFHHMAKEVAGMLSGVFSPITGEQVKPKYGGTEESFLQKIVKPIYEVIQKEAKRSKKGTAPHSVWRNYDDLNEYFWSVDCFNLDWPMRRDDKFFRSLEATAQRSQASRKKLTHILLNKTGFVEIRSFWHLFRSFHRMWAFFILSFQAMLIVAWSGPGSLFIPFQGNIFPKVLSIFITAAALRFLQGLLDIIFNLRAYHSLKYSEMLRLLLKLLVAAAWVVILLVSYVQSWQTSNRLTIPSGSRPSSYMLAILAYLVPNVLGVVFFMLPMLRRWIENSNWRIMRLMLWWSQSRLYVGRGMHESWLDLSKYSFFWISLLFCKLLFSYYVEIKPLVEPTKRIMGMTNVSYSWHEVFPQARKNIGAVISLWAPVVLVYFMDTQIWYSVFSTLAGGLCGAFMRLGEIRTLGMLRSRFQTLPESMHRKLVPRENLSQENLPSEGKSSQERLTFIETEQQDRIKSQGSVFGQIWNEVIASLREEDLISNKELDLLLVPYISNSYLTTFQWPPFLLASKVPMAIEMAAEFSGTDSELGQRIKGDDYMCSAVRECYESLKYVLKTIIIGEIEKRIVDALFEQIEGHIGLESFLSNFRMSALPSFCDLFVALIDLLIAADVFKRGPMTSESQSKYEALRSDMILVLQNMYEVVTHDVMGDEAKMKWKDIVMLLDTTQSTMYFATKLSGPTVVFPPQSDDSWSEQIKRLQLLLNNEGSALDIPTNLGARSRISFFTNSLFMDMPIAPPVHNMCSFSILTPYYDEDTMYDEGQLHNENEDGISILFYLQKIYPDEWNNFLERVNASSEDEVWEKKKAEELCHWEELRHWASYRGQTLSRTIRGMMYYKKALQLQAFQELAPKEDIKKGYKAAKKYEKNKPQQGSYWETLQATIDLKFTYVATCQNYGAQRKRGEFHAKEIDRLMKKYSSLRVAYIDEMEERKKDKTEKTYYSVLVKAIDGLDQQEVYRIKLPGPALIGEGKPENQNHAIIFTRGEALQTIDMNQDNYLEEAMKMRNLLEEFKMNHGVRAPSILGVRELIFTGSVSSLAWFMSMQESSFVTIGQRVLANPLKVRFHYGHPDVFDRLFHITRGGVSKASKGINLNEDIFAGFNSTLRRGNVTHHEYIQVGKGRDVGINKISLFEAKVANGNAEQTLSRDIYRLGHRFDFFRMMSCYFTTIGFYFNSMLVVLTVYIFLYGRLYLVLSGLESSFINQARKAGDDALQAALITQSLVQLGLVMALPMVMEIGLERGFRYALTDFVLMQLQLASVFFTFALGTKAHYYGRAILHGGARYRATGRGFVVRHERFAENYRLYSRSHFTKGFEIVILLILYEVYGSSSQRGPLVYLLVTFSMWFLAGTWLFAPFMFNPSGFEWQKTVEDWGDWNKWIDSEGHIGVPANQSWETWWETEQQHLRYTGLRGRIWEIVLATRFFLYQYGLVYHLHITQHHKNISVYGFSWLVILAALAIHKSISVRRHTLRSDWQVLFRMLEGLLFICSITVLVMLFQFAHLTIGDVFASILVFMPTGWGILQIAQSIRPLVEKVGIWNYLRSLAQTYEYTMGLVLFTPIAMLSWFPFISELQTQLLFNQAFSRGLQISRILAGRKKKIARD